MTSGRPCREEHQAEVRFFIWTWDYSRVLVYFWRMEGGAGAVCPACDLVGDFVLR
jgi:hypothetical protein